MTEESTDLENVSKGKLIEAIKAKKMSMLLRKK